MADYYSPTVVEPDIPLADMTPLEQLLLSHIFDSDPVGDALYFHEEQSTQDVIWLDLGEVRDALAKSQGIASRATDLVTNELVKVASDAEDIGLDLSMESWEFLFQDIVRRSESIAHVTVTAAFTCTKMRPDGFGGMVTVITADEILSSSTSDMLCELLDRAEFGELGCAPGHGSHILLRLEEEHVRATVETIFETEAPDGLAIADVTDADIRQASLNVKAASDLSHEEAQAAFNAALAAIRIAAERKATSA